MVTVTLSQSTGDVSTLAICQPQLVGVMPNTPRVTPISYHITQLFISAATSPAYHTAYVLIQIFTRFKLTVLYHPNR